MPKRMKYIGEGPREIPQFGVFKPGDEVEYDKTLHDTGLFDVEKEKKKEKEGDK
jgi:hypothetical protein